MRRRLRRWLAARLYDAADRVDSPIRYSDYRLGLRRTAEPEPLDTWRRNLTGNRTGT
jgi:hypothetical protein